MPQRNRVNHENCKVPKFKVFLILSMKELGYSMNVIADMVQVSLPSVAKYSKIRNPSKKYLKSLQEDLKQQINAYNHIVERGLNNEFP